MPIDIEQIAQQLSQHRWALIRDWLDPGSQQALYAEAMACAAAGTMRQATTGRGRDINPGGGTRGDQLQWLEEDHPSDPVRALLQAVNQFRQQLNARLFLNLVEFEAHFAHYPVGSGYLRHLDRFRSDDARILSAVVHLGDPWREEHRGELRLFLDGTDGETCIDLPPHPGQLVLFLSAEIEHEVLATQRDRYSIAGWLRRRSN